ncbi:Sorting nexin-13 [Gossypium australe]|uniref:Sorting nexin-13 n=1 Tax=Gossypium australe TaxID=47621 RepID=A0A5B6W5M3_9ROSI|nr:Sorting nexin-13 [Gossypium australe]
MSEPDIAIIRRDGCVCFGVLKICGKEIRSTFLAFKDEEKAVEVYKYLVENHEDWILSCHHLVQYEDEWLVALECSKNILTYFREKMEGWESENRNQSEWFSYIKEDFVKILKDLVSIWAKIDRGINTKSLAKTIFITNSGGAVKFLPNVNASDEPMEGGIDALKHLMSCIINMPFESVIRNYENFNMPNELLCFLSLLDCQNLKFVSLPFLLDAPLFWRPVDKFNFIVHLDHKIKRREISEYYFDACLSYLGKNKYTYKWESLVQQNPVLGSIYNHQPNAYHCFRHCSVVRYCSNVYRHYNDNGTQRISIVGIENELSTLLPCLYIHLFEGLIRYARLHRYQGFWTSILSGNI